jgi:hypothetical protein
MVALETLYIPKILKVGWTKKIKKSDYVHTYKIVRIYLTS